MNMRNIDVMEKYLETIEAGKPVEDCIRISSFLTPEIQKIIPVVEHLHDLHVEQVPADAVEKSHKKFLAQARQLALVDKKTPIGWRLGRVVAKFRMVTAEVFSPRPFLARLVVALIIAGVLIIFSRGLVITSAKSLPGDSLYPVKRAIENLTISLVPNREIRQQYEDNYNQLRVDEVRQLVALKRIDTVSFEGILGSRNATKWMVSGVAVDLQTGTTLIGGSGIPEAYQPGSVVEVEGITNDSGSVTANEIHLREYQIIGIVEATSRSNWQISGLQLFVTSDTQIDEGIAVGEIVEVLIRSEDNGMYALAILREEHPSKIPENEQSPTNGDSITGESWSVTSIRQLIIGNAECLPVHNWAVNDKNDDFIDCCRYVEDITINDVVMAGHQTPGDEQPSGEGQEVIITGQQSIEDTQLGNPELTLEASTLDSVISAADNHEEVNESSTDLPLTPERTESHEDGP